MVTIGFPGLGIEQFTVNKVAFTIPIMGGIEVRWYGIIITLGIVLAFFYAYYRSKQEGIIVDDLLDLAIYAVIIAIVGARLYYVLFDIIGNGNGGNYKSFVDYIAIWRGGIAIYGAIIGGALAILGVSKIKKISTLKCYDMIAPGVMIGQILGRWGNFFNGEAFGSTPAEGSLLYVMRMEVKHDGWFYSVTAHPTFLYESVWNLIGFLIINALYRKKRFDGEVFLWYITWYGFGRMFIEGLRTDSLYAGGIRISQLVGALCFAVGAVLTLVFHIRAVKRGTRPQFFTASESSAVAAVADAEAESANNAPESSYSALIRDADNSANKNTDGDTDGRCDDAASADSDDTD